MFWFILLFAIAFILFRIVISGAIGIGKAAGNIISMKHESISETITETNAVTSSSERQEAHNPKQGAKQLQLTEKRALSWTVPIILNDRIRERLYRASVDAGNKIEAACVIQSKQKGLPILAETEAELKALTNRESKAVEGDVDAICSLIVSYQMGMLGVNKSTAKAEQLRRLVLDAAENGNRMAQAASMQPGVFGEALATANRSMYESSIREAADAGNRDAQFAVGMFLESAVSYESLAWLYEAARQGNTDAAYHLVKRIDAAYYSHGLPFPEYGSTFEFIRMGATANCGVYASNLQQYVAEAYAEGECGVTADKSAARSWYRLSVKNGGSSTGLDLLDQTFRSKPATEVEYLTIEDIKSALDDKTKGNQEVLSKEKMNPYAQLSDEQLKDRISALLATDDRYDALPMAEEYIRRHPNESGGYQMKAYSVFQKDPLLAARTLSSACEHANDLYSYGLFLSAQADFYYSAGHYDTALQGFEQWWEGYKKGNFDKDDFAVFGYALTLRRFGKTGEAFKILNGYTALDESFQTTIDTLKKEILQGKTLEESQFT